VLPRVISVDDHVVEPPNLWLDLNSDETAALLRGNAIQCSGLDRYFGLEV
jgi:hypothetical protein